MLEAAGAPQHSLPRRPRTKDSRIAELGAALKWALEHGAEARLSPRGPGGIIFRNGGDCACCSMELTPPEELRPALLEIAGRIRRDG